MKSTWWEFGSVRIGSLTSNLGSRRVTTFQFQRRPEPISRRERGTGTYLALNPGRSGVEEAQQIGRQRRLLGNVHAADAAAAQRQHLSPEPSESIGRRCAIAVR